MSNPFPTEVEARLEEQLRAQQQWVAELTVNPHGFTVVLVNYGPTVDGAGESTDRPFVLGQCPRCAAVAIPENWAFHADWHRRVEELVGAALELVPARRRPRPRKSTHKKKARNE